MDCSVSKVESQSVADSKEAAKGKAYKSKVESQSELEEIDQLKEIILLDARGKKYEVYRSVLILSQYFNNMLGEGEFKKSKKRDDGSYYVDCDIEILKLMIGYIETGILRYSRYNTKYLVKIFAKFGINLEYKKHIDPEKKSEQDIQKLLQQIVTEKIKTESSTKDHFSIKCKFIIARNYSVSRHEDLILITTPFRIYVENLCRHSELLAEFLNPIDRDGYGMIGQFSVRERSMYEPYILSIKFTRPEIIEEEIDVEAFKDLDLSKPDNYPTSSDSDSEENSKPVREKAEEKGLRKSIFEDE